MSSRVSNSTNTRKSRCTFCVNKGFSENVYSTHNVKNAQGKVTCIALLNHICSNCNRNGHTRGNCTVKHSSSANDRMTTVSVAFSKDGGKTISKPLYCASISANRFAQLEEDEVQEDTKKTVSTTLLNLYSGINVFMHESDMGLPLNCIHLDTIPRIDLKSEQKQQQPKTYAFVLTNVPSVVVETAAAAAAAAAAVTVTKPVIKPIIRKKYNWADVDSDSDDE